MSRAEAETTGIAENEARMAIIEFLRLLF